MFRLLGSFVWLVSSACILAPASGQTPPDPPQPTPPAVSTEGAARLDSEVRFKLIQELYGLEAEQVAKLRATFEPQIARQEQYEQQTAVTLRRLALARRIVLDNRELDEAARDRQIANFDAQYYQIIADGPLSVANIAGAAERLLSNDQVLQARERIKERLGVRLAALGGPEPRAIDRVMAGPVPPAELPQAFQPRPVSPERVALPTTEATAPQDIGVSRADAAQLVKPQPSVAAPPPVQVARPRVSPKPAPPEAEWQPFVERTAAELAFTPDQKSRAETALTQVRSRASAYRERHAADYQGAEKLADAGQRAEALRKLNEPLDLLFDELTQRVEALASLEQLQKAGRPIPAPPPPAPPPPAKTAEPPRQLTAQEAHTHQHAPAPSAAAAPVPPKLPPPAPPIQEWTAPFQKRADELGFSPEQRRLANQIFESCQARARLHREQRQADYEAAEKLTDPAKKAETMKGLNERVDLLYQEMIQRIEALATLEQVQKAGKARR